MSYNTSAQMIVVNQFSGPANIILKHEYSDEGLFSNRWINIASRGQSTTPWSVGYNTGFLRYGQDYWSIQVEVQSSDQGGIWRTDTFSCTLHADDANQTLQFSVGPNGLVLEKPSGVFQQVITKLV